MSKSRLKISLFWGRPIFITLQFTIKHLPKRKSRLIINQDQSRRYYKNHWISTRLVQNIDIYEQNYEIQNIIPHSFFRLFLFIMRKEHISRLGELPPF